MWKAVWLVVLAACVSEQRAPAPQPPRIAADAAQSAAPSPAAAVPNVLVENSDAGAALPALGAPPADMDLQQASACAAGQAAACVAAALSFAPQGAYRVTLTKDEADARERETTRYAWRACELGQGEGCALAARYGEYSALDARLTRACDLGYVASCGSLGARRFYGVKRGHPLRMQSAALVERACLANVHDWRALTDKPGAFCHTLFEWYRDKALPKDREAQQRFLALACQQGYRVDCACKTDADCGEDQLCDGTCRVVSTH